MKLDVQTHAFTDVDASIGKNPTATNPERIEVELDVARKATREIHHGAATVIAACHGDKVGTLIHTLKKEEPFSDLDEEDVVNSLTYVLDALFTVGLQARILQVNELRPGTTPKKFRKLNIHHPIFAAYGECPLVGGARLMPVAGDELQQEAKRLGFLTDTGRATIPEWYRMALTLFHSYGLRYSEGLPVDTIIDSPTVYGIDIEEDGKVVGPELINPTAVEIVTSLFVKSSRISNLLGAYAVQYDHLSLIINTLRSIGQKSVHTELDS